MSLFTNLQTQLTNPRNRFVKVLLEKIESAFEALAIKRIFGYSVEDLSAGADIANRVILEAPSGVDITLVSAKLISHGTATGIDDSNTCVIALTDGTNAIVTKTFNASTVFPADGAIVDLGALSSTYKILSAGEKLYLSVTNGTTANPPAFMIQLVYNIAEAA